MRSLPVAVFAFAVSLTTVRAADQVTVIVGRGAADLEHFAARELVGQFKRLFGVNVVLADSIPDRQDKLVLLGSPSRNAAVRAIAGGSWPRLSDQGFLLRSFDRDGRRGVMVGGESPVATLWAVYELGHRFGIRYLLREDMFPDPQPLKLSGFDVIMEPELRTRTWRTISDSVIGSESWGIDDHQKLLRQLAKLKFNSVMLSISPWHPFVHYEFRGVKKQTGALWFGERFVIDAETPGRVAFASTGEFTNPDLSGAATYEQMTESGIRHVRQIMLEAQRLGMSVGVAISALEFPREFRQVLPGLEALDGLRNLSCVPSDELPPDDPGLKELVATKLRAYIETYPKIDRIYLTPSEVHEWQTPVDSAWQQLSQLIGKDAPSLDSLMKSAGSRPQIAAGDRGERSIKGNIVALAFLHNLLADSKLLQRADGSSVDLTITSVDPVLYPVLDRVIPARASTLNFVDETARRTLENTEILEALPADRVRSQLVITLADDHVGVLSQAATRSISELVEVIRKSAWDGFATQCRMLAELDPTVHFLSRAAWDRDVTARSAHDDLFATITGKQSASDRLWLAMGYLEAAAELTGSSGSGFSFPLEGMLMKHYCGDPAPDWWEQQNKLYTEAMIELYRAASNRHPRADRRMFYWAKRSEYVLEYLGAVKAVRAAGIARKKGQNEEVMAQLEVAIESLYNAMDTLSDVVEDQSDRGLIATLNRHAWRPLTIEYEKLLEEPEH